MKKSFRPFAVIAALLLWSCSSFAGLSKIEKDHLCIVQSDHFRLTLDSKHGGEVTKIELFDGSQWNAVSSPDEGTLPRIQLNEDSKELLLANDREAEIRTIESTPEKVLLEVAGSLCDKEGKPSPWKAKLVYEIHPEGALFIDFHLDLLEGAFKLSRASVGFTVDPAIVSGPKYKAQGTMTGGKGFKSGRIAFGGNPVKSYTNEMEIYVEYLKPLTGKVDFKEEKGRFTWILGGDSSSISGPYHYENRISVALGSTITGKPRSNVIGQRVYHWVNFDDTVNWYPTNEQIDKMVRNYGTMLIMHHEWMKQRGSNGRPHADYTVLRNDKEMLRTIAYAHEKGMRVGLYMRGVEIYALDTKFFEKYLKKNWDGIYVDWHGPACVSYHEQENKPDPKVNDSHFSEDGTYVAAREYFLYMKRMREIVGPEGFLIGHQGSFNPGIFANLGFDAYLPGETGGDHKMFSSMDVAAWNGMTGGGVCMPWTLDSPDFRTEAGAAKMAAWGFYPHLVMGIKRPNAKVGLSREADHETHAWVLPYWRVLKNIDVEKTTVYNLPSDNRVAVTFSNPSFGATVYKQEDGSLLVIAANLGKEAASADLTLDAGILGLKGSYNVSKIHSITGEITSAGKTENQFTTSTLPPWGIEGFQLIPSKG